MVTGGSRGIGRAIAERLAQDGAAVGVTYARDETAAGETVENIRKNGGRAFAFQAGLGERGDAARLWAAFDAAGTEHVPDGKLDIIVNNVGIGDFASLESLTEDAFDKVFAVNVRAPFFVTQQGLPRLRDGGRIINISSSVARLATPGMIAYGATKGALDTSVSPSPRSWAPGASRSTRWPPEPSSPMPARPPCWAIAHAEAQAASLDRPRPDRAAGRHGRPSWPSSPPTTHAG
ncbi:SDR family NAD(P)-dependent oxidoreductase [Streptomyces mutabilis]|uniref:SDR family NAD(P)-dependent oxidoreductase n=1 Tax=Streptomyces mutabilis TaxID=67332 RepID=UPI0035F079E8